MSPKLCAPAVPCVHYPQVPSAALVQQLMEDAALAASGSNLQPWRVAALAGGRCQALLVEVAAAPAQESDALLSYPPDLWEALPQRAALSMAKTCTAAWAFHAKTSRPACAIWPRMRNCWRTRRNMLCLPMPAWATRSGWTWGFLQSLMLRATEEALATCAQGFWRRYSALVHRHVAMPRATNWRTAWLWGIEDTAAPVNALRTARADFR